MRRRGGNGSSCICALGTDIKLGLATITSTGTLLLTSPQATAFCYRYRYRSNANIACSKSSYMILYNNICNDTTSHIRHGGSIIYRTVYQHSPHIVCIIVRNLLARKRSPSQAKIQLPGAKITPPSYGIRTARSTVSRVVTQVCPDIVASFRPHLLNSSFIPLWPLAEKKTKKHQSARLPCMPSIPRGRNCYRSIVSSSACGR